MKKNKYYKVKSQLSSHKDLIGKYMSSFMEQGEKHYTLRFDGQEFRSYPSRNLREYSLNFFSTKDIIAMMREAEKMFRPKKEKVKHKIKRFKDFISYTEVANREHCFAIDENKIYNVAMWKMNNILDMLDYLAGETEKLKNK